MKLLIIARHTNNKITGEENKRSTDGSITETGRLQAEEMKSFLAKYDLECIFTSLYLRTIETADIINKDRNIKTVKSNAFNEYLLRPDGSGVEGVDTAQARSMSKIYSFFDLYENVLIVGHSSINQTMYHSLTNIDYSTSREMFNSYGEIRVLRYDYKQGDSKWVEIDNFTPSQD